MTRWDRVAWVVGVAALVALWAGVAFAAGGKPTIEATQFKVNNAASGAEFAKCGRGERALGGGVVQSGPAGGLNLHASGPLDASGATLNTNDGDKAKQWYASINNNSGLNDRVFRVFAICTSRLKATIQTTQFTVGDQQTGEEFARCGRRKRALGGGVVQSGPPDDVYVWANGPLDASGVTLNTNDGDKAKQWYAAVRNASGADREFRVFVICDADSKATIEAKQFTVDSFQTGEEFAKCGRRKRALGGGIVQSGSPTGLYIGANGPLDASGVTLNTNDGDKAKQWYASVGNQSGINDRVFRVFAICSRGT